MGRRRGEKEKGGKEGRERGRKDSEVPNDTSIACMSPCSNESLAIQCNDLGLPHMHSTHTLANVCLLVLLVTICDLDSLHRRLRGTS